MNDGILDRPVVAYMMAVAAFAFVLWMAYGG